jgi:hypothetical protein
MPSSGSPGTWIVTVSGCAPPRRSSVATKNAGTGAGSTAARVEESIRHAVWKWPRTRPSEVSTELST